MRLLLRLVAVAALIGGGTWWLAAGANRGWTKTSVPVVQVDEVTGLESRIYERRLMPGVEVLGAFLAAAGLAGAGSLVMRPKPPC